ncbi:MULTISPECIES: hypothetical protein [Rhizobium]|uniref:Uncharacterized protein n=1 Tax=Rhizobium phaseoli TaxID=396 RepID=A0A7X6F795_9HYPH|nr:MULTISPECIES: hypothetical protein [Rhizobium]MDE8763049.1 hypothetical protein [Rhizobium sp. CBK13]NKF13344.1 hypothetical protein [Rhizobium phaseoli]QPK13252.1 hypothetical protein HER27_031590 [Rhizobium phaseoli]
MMNPLIAILKNRSAKAIRMVIAIFEREVRSRRGANRAVTKVQQANLDDLPIADADPAVNEKFSR